MEIEAQATRPVRAANPAAFHFGPAHVIVHGNDAFLAAFGAGCLGQPAREALVSLPSEAFRLMDTVYREGRSLATRIRTPDGPRRLVIAARRDPETGETYGVASHIRPVTPEAAG
jgi:PAS domain-containing protein